MRLVRTVLLGSTAFFSCISTTYAADLTTKKGAPIEYVRICSVHGSGFFYIPGSDTCLKIRGNVYGETLYQSGRSKSEDRIGWETEARIGLDARTRTQYGTVRAYLRFKFISDSGTPYDSTREDSNDTAISQGFVQFAGLTAGRAASFFDFSEGANLGTLRYSDGVKVNLLAYTATFGNGFSATLSLEDPAQRRAFGAGAVGAIDPLTGEFSDTIGGTRLPEIVASLRAEQSWGAVQVMGALHQLRDAGGFNTPRADDEYGFALGLGTKINLPMLAEEDYLWVNLTYTKGALGYMGFEEDNLTDGLTIGRETFAYSDAFLVDNGNGTSSLVLSSSWQAALGIQHHWTATVASSLFGSYARINAAEHQGTALADDITEYRIGGNVSWSPIDDLTLTAEALYAKAEGSRSGIVGYDAAGLPLTGKIERSDDAWEGRFRVQRDF